MLRTIFAALLIVAGPAAAQELATYNRALSAFNAGNYNEAAVQFWDVNNKTTDADLRAKAEYYLASTFLKSGLPVSAMVYYASIVKTGKSHPFYLKAVEGMVNVQDQLDDQWLIPSTLDRNYNDDWVTLPAEVLSRINFLVGYVSWHRQKFDETRSFLEAVPQESTVYVKAQYLLGVLLADPRFPGDTDKNQRDAIAAFETVINNKLQGQKDLEQTQHLALLGLGRVYYGQGQYEKAVGLYERVPRFSKYWDQALFENGFARFRNSDPGGALGSLQALHAPQFAGAFQPESWLLKSTVYYYACLHAEAKTALGEFDALYAPMIEQLKPLAEGEQRDIVEYFKLVDTTESDRIPKPVLNWVRSNERMLGVFNMLKQIDAEKAKLEANQGWRAARLSDALIGDLNVNADTLQKAAGTLAKRRIVDAYRMVKTYSNDAEIIRFETSKAEKELAEAGVDQRGLLKQQTLYRPQMPGENWNYWRFQGEFWRDEIGYYQYTLKQGVRAAPGGSGVEQCNAASQD